MTGDANSVLHPAHQLPTVHVEERAGLSKRIPTELLLQLHDGRSQALHRRTASAELRQQPGFDELPPGHRVVPGLLDAHHRRVVHTPAVVAVDPPAPGACGQREQPVDVSQGVDAAIEQRDRHLVILARSTNGEPRIISA